MGVDPGWGRTLKAVTYIAISAVKYLAHIFPAVKCRQTQTLSR